MGVDQPQLVDEILVLGRRCVATLAAAALGAVGGGRLVATPIPAKRYDTGNKLDYLKANVEFALKREDLREDFTAYLKELTLDL